MVNEYGMVECWSAGKGLRSARARRCRDSAVQPPSLHNSNTPSLPRWGWGWGWLSTSFPIFPPLSGKSKKARVPAYSRIFQPLPPPGEGDQMANFIQTCIACRVGICRNMSDYFKFLFRPRIHEIEKSPISRILPPFTPLGRGCA
jgi:hypothetical protein